MNKYTRDCLSMKALVKCFASMCMIFSLLTASCGALAQQTSTSADASTDQHFRIAGKIDKVMLEKFDAAIRIHPTISELEFDGVMDSREIDIEAIMGFHQRIKQYHLSTTARGLCIGSCALLFMTGYTRTVLPGVNKASTRVGLRPLTNQQDEFMMDETDALIAEIVRRSDGKITLEFIRKIYLVRDEIASLMIQLHAGKSDVQVIFLERAGQKFQLIEPSTAEDYGLKIGSQLS
ncbi:hypothetical protein [Undibacterium pigrum]|uniref:Uncharacterized protein n=1 Tax=Undibacterium pigrum TaxID=401470 RepID=A0A318J041_9BURK|nr:hypothetical protein [Undibacterium pigrum]PXX37308.1 hypothetical protein DFR42_1162 [Undibacterium pigrum]